jgi:alpha-tubulin suppressor-like RCC1 family protein
MHIQQPSSSPNGPKEYKRSREKQKMPTGSNSVLPQEVSDMFPGDTVIQLSCGSFHSLLLTSAGEVFSWGSNGSGQLGHPQTSELVRFIILHGHKWADKPFMLIPKISVSCGVWSENGTGPLSNYGMWTGNETGPLCSC